MPVGRPPCRECGASTETRQQRCLCPDCARLFCNRCEEPLPFGYRRRTCLDCRKSKRSPAGAGRSCRECGKAVHFTASRPLCPTCVQRFCCHCDQALPEGRKDRRCLECWRVEREARLGRSSRLCSYCRRRPATARSEYCPECHREWYEFDRKRKLALSDRTCKTCPTVLARGRHSNWCAACLKARRREKAGQRTDQRCYRCRERQRILGTSYCRPCTRLQENMARAIRNGDRVAMILRPVKSKTKWQVRDVQESVLPKGVAADQAAHP